MNLEVYLIGGQGRTDWHIEEWSEELRVGEGEGEGRGGDQRAHTPHSQGRKRKSWASSVQRMTSVYKALCPSKLLRQ